MTIPSNPKIEAFYFSELPRILFWIGLAVVVFNIGLFLMNWIYGGAPRLDLLLPDSSGLVFGVVALLLSVSIKTNGLFTLLLSLAGPIWALFFYQQLQRGIEGISPALPLEMGILILAAILFCASLFFISLTYKYRQENKFPG